MPEGISVQNVTVKLKYNNSDQGFTYPTLDGKSYKVENLNGKITILRELILHVKKIQAMVVR